MRDFKQELFDFICEHELAENVCYETLADGETIYDKVDELWGSDTEGYFSEYETCPGGHYRVVVVNWFNGIVQDQGIFFVERFSVEEA